MIIILAILLSFISIVYLIYFVRDIVRKETKWSIYKQRVQLDEKREEYLQLQIKQARRELKRKKA